MTDDLNVARIRGTLDFIELKISALNRGFIMFLNVLQHKGILNEHEVSWIDRIKRDAVLAKTIDNENLMDRVLEVADKVSCPEKSDAAIKLIKSHIVKPKTRLPKL